MRYSINLTLAAKDFISPTDRHHSCEERYPEDFLEGYSLGARGAPYTGDFEEHMIVCASCQVRLAEVERWIKDVCNALGADLNNRPAETPDTFNFLESHPKGHSATRPHQRVILPPRNF